MLIVLSSNLKKSKQSMGFAAKSCITAENVMFLVTKYTGV